MECFIEIFSQADLQGRGLRTFEVDARFVDVFTIQAGPQRRTGNENLPPSIVYVGQCGQIFIPIAVVSDEREDLGGDLVYRCERVLRRPNEA